MTTSGSSELKIREHLSTFNSIATCSAIGCGEAAHKLRCAVCKVAYYCSSAHAKKDYKEKHALLCPFWTKCFALSQRLMLPRIPQLLSEVETKSDQVSLSSSSTAATNEIGTSSSSNAIFERLTQFLSSVKEADSSAYAFFKSGELNLQVAITMTEDDVDRGAVDLDKVVWFVLLPVGSELNLEQVRGTLTKISSAIHVASARNAAECLVPTSIRFMTLFKLPHSSNMFGRSIAYAYVL